MGRKKRPDTTSSQSTRTSPQETQAHFSHPHILKLVNPSESETLTCNACEQQNTNNKPFYGCNACQYFLHENCLNAPCFLDHSSHPSHPLTLHPMPTYPTRSYLCNACGSVGNAFSFSCARCQFDIHVQCASCPSSILVDKHEHQLELIFGSPYQDKDIEYFCDICDAVMNKDNWLYYCADCDFGAHLQCASPELVVYLGSQPINQNPNPIPNANSTLEMINSVNEANQQVFEAQVATRMMAQLGQDMLESVRPTRRYYHY
ncbi:protein VACUOLELESS GAMETOPHYTES-like [Lycium barbarum]|uniref:protein VACUOLELESS GAMETOPHYTES-like n=1 Tax=Lycium barbarum TaxID=112863 RepID=UPI00293E5EC8|nr:protein VACUOLELESS GAMETOPHYTES-like [Lycium barbarum]